MLVPTEPLATPEPPAKETEHERVVAYRALRLLDAGFSTMNAHLLSMRTDVDLHLAERLAAQAGPDLALSILY